MSSTCPICGAPSAEGSLAPFCSDRCKKIDLGRWLKGYYVVPTDEAPDEATLETLLSENPTALFPEKD